ncbi:DUF2752 domain-containing protein [Candidatus Laterigemmans baculatus]|uniref:DUF2752 domain-containing protein n=1 Tax=Candidatus Laterigemmans baculatus TaxID=2770505 RepID=UPI00193C331D|nr:DUF2752 domain-containing protein [Candidatus Laterigemmans baculatus]
MTSDVGVEAALVEAALVEEPAAEPVAARACADHPLAPTAHRLLAYGWLVWLVGSGGILLLAAVLEFRPPRTIVVPLLEFSLPETCTAQQMLGINCPGCGMTRSFVLAADGELARAWAMHPIGTLLFLLLVLQIPWRLWQGWQTVRGQPVWRTGQLEWRIGVALVAASFLWWALSFV